jgi:hypothetical protein
MAIVYSLSQTSWARESMAEKLESKANLEVLLS